MEIDDLVQEGWLAALERAAKYDANRGTSFMGYVQRRTRGAMIDLCRAERRIGGAALAEDAPPFVEILASQEVAASPEDLLLIRERTRERRSSIARAVWALDPEDRRLAWRVLAQGASLSSAARSRGLSRSAARYRLDRAIARLERALFAAR